MSVDPNHYLRMAIELARDAGEKVDLFRKKAWPDGEVDDVSVGEARRLLEDAHKALSDLYVSRSTRGT